MSPRKASLRVAYQRSCANAHSRVRSAARSTAAHSGSLRMQRERWANSRWRTLCSSGISAPICASAVRTYVPTARTRRGVLPARRLTICAACKDRLVQIDPEGVEIRALGKLAPMDGLHVLELGCGDGRVTLQIAEAAASVYAIDPDEERIRLARESLPAELAHKVSFEVAGAAEVSVPRRRFDLALFSWSL
jgi:2-polyprenyl-3-methyl-5-hydroxy-6-metoxy-1,4-benzoquinol methylase